MFKWFPFLWGNLTRRRLRTSLTMASVVATFILFGLLESFRYAVTTYADDYSNALLVQSRNVPLPYAHMVRLQSFDGVTSACGVLLAEIQLPSQKHLWIQGVPDSELFKAHPGIELDGTARERWHRERASALVDRELASQNGWKVGDRITLPGVAGGAVFERSDGRNALELVIAGIYSTRTRLAAKGIFVRYEYIRDVVGPDWSGLQYIAVRIARVKDVDGMRSRIDKEFQNSAAATKTYSFRALLRAYYGTFRNLATLALIVVSVSAVTLLLIAGSVLAQSHQERIREVALMEALGISRWRLLELLALETFAMTAPAAIVGLLIAGFLAQHVDTGVAITSNGLLPVHTLATGLTFVTALIGAIAFVPALRMMRAPIAENLRWE
jgi:putative ABC transport system permease protein